MHAQYVFAVRIRLTTTRSDVTLEPQTLETILSYTAPEPGTDGWLFFRDMCWRGEVTDEQYARSLLSEWVEGEIETVEFQELQAETAYFDALKTEISDTLELFNATTVTEVCSKYLGSSIRITDN